MKATHIASFLLAGLAFLSLGACSKEKESVISDPRPSEKPAATLPPEIPGEAKVYFSEEMTALVEEAAGMGTVVTKSSALNDLVSELGITSMRRLFPHAGEFEERTRREGLHRWYKITFDNEIPVTKAGERLLSLPGVNRFFPSRRIRSRAKTPNDTYWGYMWPLSSDNGINVKDVWEKYTTGNPDVIVCVVDGGIQLDHPDLKWNCLSSGHYNYVDGNKTITPHDHGTHVAGTIAAVSNNRTGVTGIAGGDYAAGQRGISLLSHQVFRTRGNEDVSGDTETAIKEGADHGALISQNSWGYYFDEDHNDDVISAKERELYQYYFENPDSAFVEAVDYFVKYAGCDNKGNQLPGSLMKGGVVIFAAGNDDIPYGPPANYEPCIAVGATQQNGTRASFSDYGDWVDICAPGVDIASTVPTNEYALMRGTSMACPHVSGVAALLISHFGGAGFTNEKLKEALLGGARKVPASTGTKPIGPMLDALGAFQLLDYQEPEENNPPVLGGETHLGTFHQYETVSIPMEIYDPDGHELTVTCANAGRAEIVRVDGVWTFRLDCRLSQPGSFTMTVTATDKYRLSAQKEYTYEVLKNAVPVVAASFDNCQLPAVGERTVIAVSDHFSDADGEPLTYTATSQDAAVVSAALDDIGRMTLQANGFGVTEVSIVATDAMREHAVATVKVLVRKPAEVFSIYPDSSVLGSSLAVLTGISTAEASVRLVSSTGVTIYQYKGYCSAFDPVIIDTSSMIPGVYYLVVVFDGTTHKKTLIKK